ncbi:hypothetical protein [Haloarcula onubensis]|nr:hypothetical protein [Halomicroarcula sp. S3CR25-11]
MAAGVRDAWAGDDRHSVRVLAAHGSLSPLAFEASRRSPSLRLV